MSAPELRECPKPCPFCGSEPIPVPQILAGDGDRWQIWSVCCGLECGRGPQRGNGEGAIAAWNRRVPTEQPRGADVEERVRLGIEQAARGEGEYLDTRDLPTDDEAGAPTDNADPRAISITNSPFPPPPSGASE